MVTSGEVVALVVDFRKLRGLDMAVGVGDMEIGMMRETAKRRWPRGKRWGAGPARNHLRIFHAGDGLTMTAAKCEM